MAEWEKEIAVLKTDIRYIRDDVSIMQKQLRDLNKTSNMGVGGLKVFLVIGSILAAIQTFMKITNQGGKMEKLKSMWNDLSKKGKIALVAVVVIAVIVAYNAII